MKLNFKEWNIIYEALTDKARAIASDLKWREDWQKEHEAEEDSDTRDLRTKLNAVNGIIRNIENSAI